MTQVPWQTHFRQTKVIFWREVMKRISVLVLILCAYFVSAAWGQQPAGSDNWSELQRTNMMHWNPSEWAQLAKLIASNGLALNYFGLSVAISGDTIVVGSGWVGVTCGVAYVFVKPASGWANMSEVAELQSSDCGDEFGISVAIRGNTVVVGARYGDYVLTSGKAYVFVKPKGGWRNMTETAILTPSDKEAYDFFGSSLTISSDTIVVGAPRSPYNNLTAGAAYVFVKPSSGWANMTETAKLTASDGTDQDQFGASVSVSGDTVAVVGGFFWGTCLGSAYVFVKPSSGWANMTETAKLTASNGDPVSTAVSIKADTIVAGAPAATVGSNSAQGAAYVFVKPATGWVGMTETAKLTARDGAVNDYFGSSASFGGYRIVAGAPNATIGANSSQGAAYVFARPATGWVTTSKYNGKVKAADGSAGDAFGSSVSICNGVVVAGAPDATVGSNSRQGAAYVFGKH